jgi:predicted DNA-binding transcriptional regulator AlpA
MATQPTISAHPPVEASARARPTKFDNLSSREWLSLQQAAHFSGYSESTFCRFVRDGTAPPSVKLKTGPRRFRRADVDSWIVAGGPVTCGKTMEVRS